MYEVVLLHIEVVWPVVTDPAKLSLLCEPPPWRPQVLRPELEEADSFGKAGQLVRADISAKPLLLFAGLRANVNCLRASEPSDDFTLRTTLRLLFLQRLASSPYNFVDLCRVS